MWWLLVLLALLAGPASAQTAVNCPIYDTATLSINVSSVISDCTINVGPKGVAFVTVTGELSCTAGGSASNAAFWLEAVAAPSSGGTARPKGASFTGSITGGVLTVTGMLTPAGFVIDTPVTMPGVTIALYDATNGTGIPKGVTGSTLTINGAQIDGTPGGIGHYPVSDNTVTVGSETIWALYNWGNNTQPSGALSLVRGPMEHLRCASGSTYVVNYTGVVRGAPTLDFGTNNNIVILVGLFSESISGQPPVNSFLKNGQISAAVPGVINAPSTGGLVQ